MKNIKNVDAKKVAAFQSSPTKSASFTNKNPQPSQPKMGSQPQGGYKQPVKNQDWQQQITNRNSNLNCAAGKACDQK